MNHFISTLSLFWLRSVIQSLETQKLLLALTGIQREETCKVVHTKKARLHIQITPNRPLLTKCSGVMNIPQCSGSC